MPLTMQAYWQDQADVVESSNPRPMSLAEAQDQWADGRGCAGNFFGLIDNDGATIQFYFAESIPDHIEDAGDLKIVLMDFPIPDQNGSYQKLITINESAEAIQKAFQLGVSYKHFDELEFRAWS